MPSAHLGARTETACSPQVHPPSGSARWGLVGARMAPVRRWLGLAGGPAANRCRPRDRNAQPNLDRVAEVAEGLPEEDSVAAVHLGEDAVSEGFVGGEPGEVERILLRCAVTDDGHDERE